MAHTDIGRQVLIRLQQDLAEVGVVEQYPSMEGRQMTMMIGPKKK